MAQDTPRNFGFAGQFCNEIDSRSNDVPVVVKKGNNFGSDWFRGPDWRTGQEGAAARLAKKAGVARRATTAFLVARLNQRDHGEPSSRL